jgi:hypothetical protein
MTYAVSAVKVFLVEIEIELGEFTYVRKENPWTEDHKVWVFNNRWEAEEEAKRWNTGRVVSYIRTMSKSERQRSEEKGQTNV